MSRLSLLVDLAAILPKQIDLDALLGAAAERIAEALSAERATIWLVDAEEQGLVAQVAILPEVERLIQPLGKGISGHVATSGESLLIDDVSEDPRFDPRADEETGYTTRNMAVVPIRDTKDKPVRGVLQVLNKKTGSWTPGDLEYLNALGEQLANVFSLTTLVADDDAQPGLNVRGRYNKVIGTSAAMEEVYQKVSLAAETDATVLLTGETGTGKGVIARALHDNSLRLSGPFVVLDATTLPAQLVESELFGHERGAFTGADRRVIGKVERAAGGTLFIDELGELPLESQGKLLRLLQDREFERVGGRETLKADVRVVCATHRNLKELVDEGKFRSDLLYRVKVVEIKIPPLRARGSQEIALLMGHFGRMYAARYKRPTPQFDDQLMNIVTEHPWPGNVRELEHWVESAVVLNPGGQVSVSQAPDDPQGPLSRRSSAKTVLELPQNLSLDEAIKRYATWTLEECDGNKSETASRLGISRNRLARLLTGDSEEPS